MTKICNAALAATVCLQILAVMPASANASTRTVTVELAPDSNTGLWPKGGWTNLDRPSLRGKAPDGATVEVFSGNKLLCRATASRKGLWQCRISSIRDGFYSVFAVSGGSESEHITLRVDTKPPPKPTFYPFFAKQFLSADGQSSVYISDTGRLSLDGRASECGEIVITEGGKTLGRLDSNCDAWGKEVDLKAGSHQMAARLIDQAGNSSQPAFASLVVSGSLAATKLADMSGGAAARFYSSKAPRGAQFSLASAGDVDGDGLSDIVLGENGFLLEVAGTWTARAHIVFGSTRPPKTPTDVTTLVKGRAVELVTPARQSSGLSVAGAGDVNGDGFQDVLVGWPTASILGREEAGVAYVVFGGPDLPRSINLEELDGVAGFKIAGPKAGSRLAGSLAGPGDVNGDGFADIALVVSRSQEKPARPHSGVTVVFGRGGAFPGLFDLADLDSRDGFDVTGTLSGSEFDAPTLATGDFNGDGFADVAAGYKFTGQGKVDLYEAPGKILVVFGGPKKKLRSGSVDKPTDGVNAMTISGRAGFPVTRANLGTALASGDFDGDGITDLAACGRGCSNTFVIYGGKNFRRGSIKIEDIGPADGFAYANLAGDARAAMNGAGDANGDGRDDVMVSDFESAGVIQLAFGQRKMKLPVWPIAPVSAESGMLFGGSKGEAAGTTLSPAGDFNGDGVDDFIISTSYVYPKKRILQAIVVFGKKSKRD